ncbi:hypothetical protein ALC56_08946 [Trachymyrmex septentrionalis]|uniref:Uncharacterized protein n=1 Tax=Trachymyrmex septentrionalis TaxID=34720 RepID=A0A195F974_9HYME|nr:hypothetical protein ALC56_08946 [Trachymyrmex septentrionalis]
MPGNTLTLSTDDGEQAGEENDRMAPHHLFSPSFPPRGYFHPAVLQLVFTFLVSCRTRSQLYRIYLVQSTTRVIAPFDEPGCQQEYALDPPYIGSIGCAATTCAKLVV